MSRQWTMGERAELLRCRKAGMPFGEIAARLGRSYAAVTCQYYTIKYPLPAKRFYPCAGLRAEYARLRKKLGAAEARRAIREMSV